MKQPQNPARPQPLYIFLDLDGVIADFDRHAREAGKLTKQGKPDYDKLEQAWWATMPAFKGAEQFYQELRRLGEVKFLTGPVPLSDCFGGKAEWVSNFDRRRGRWALKDLIICPSNDKQLLGGPGRILIDDRPENIRQWQQAGGLGVLHRGNFSQTLHEVRVLSAALRQSKNHNFSPPRL